MLSFDMLRPDDLLVLTVEAHNLRLDPSSTGPALLRHEDPESDAHLIFVFPPQAFGEEAFTETEIAQATPAPPGQTGQRIAGPSRLAFLVPRDAAIPFSIAGLLDWSGLTPALAPAALAPVATGAAIVPPAALETGIELPWRLTLSPGDAARWEHAAAPRLAGGRVELWHTRLVPGGEDSVAQPTARAIHSPDHRLFGTPSGTVADAPFRSALTAADRHALVRLTSVQGTETAPITLRRLALSSLGGWLEAEGRWPPGSQGLALASWRHDAALGRDLHVEVATRGLLYPLMHRATRLVVTERRFEPGAAGEDPVAYLRQYVRIIVDERERAYGGPGGDRAMPFRSVRIGIAQTPKVETPSLAQGCFGIRLGGVPWPFPCTGLDDAGNALEFGAPLIFVVADADLAANLTRASTLLAGLPDAAARPAPFRVAATAREDLSAQLVLEAMRFGAEGGRTVLDLFRARVPSLAEVTGRAEAVAMRLAPGYVQNGLDAATGTFATIADAGGLPAAFGAAQAGGIANPDMTVRHLSQRFGPLGELAGNALDLDKTFGDAGKLFGAFPLKDLLDAAAGLDRTAPGLRTRLEPAPPQVPRTVVTTYHWEAPTKDLYLKLITFRPEDPKGDSRLMVDVTLRRPLDGTAPPATEVTGGIGRFTIGFAGVVSLGFARFGFKASGGRAPELTVKLKSGNPVAFDGALKFLGKLADELPPNPFGGSGPRLSIRPDGISAGFGIALPPLALGAFSLRNLGFSTDVTLPFASGRPSLAIAFSSREKPFALSVLILGGGGFVRVELDTEGVRLVEAAIEFGGMVALDFGVASGSIHALAGIYIALGKDRTELTGYLRIGGEVTVLGLVSISIEVNLSLSYVDPRQVRGRASLTVSVRVAFLSTSVTIAVERTFSAGSEHLSIGRSLDAVGWAEYAAAFG